MSICWLKKWIKKRWGKINIIEDLFILIQLQWMERIEQQSKDQMHQNKVDLLVQSGLKQLTKSC
jgi:hypothetical protein